MVVENNNNNNNENDNVQEEKKELSFFERLFNLTLKVRISLIFSGAFIFLAALAWRDAVDQFISTCCPKKNTLMLKFLWAAAITIFVILFLYVLDEVVLKITESDKRGLN